MTHPDEPHPHEADGEHLHPEAWTLATSKGAFPNARPSEYAEFVTEEPASRPRDAGEGVETDTAELPSAAKGEPAGTVKPAQGERAAESGRQHGS